MVLETWPIDRFVFYARNPRKNDQAVDRMCASIREFGFKCPVLARSDGTVVDNRIVQPHGGPADPVTNDELIAKYRSLVGPLMPTPRLDAIQRTVLGIDKLTDIRDLASLLAAPVEGALDRKDDNR